MSDRCGTVGPMLRSTEYRINERELALRAEAERYRAEDD
jgi:hypothetical protein